MCEIYCEEKQDFGEDRWFLFLVIEVEDEEVSFLFLRVFGVCCVFGILIIYQGLIQMECKDFVIRLGWELFFFKDFLRKGFFFIQGV